MAEESTKDTASEITKADDEALLRQLGCAGAGEGGGGGAVPGWWCTQQQRLADAT
jgi:hypothetical protein